MMQVMVLKGLLVGLFIGLIVVCVPQPQRYTQISDLVRSAETSVDLDPASCDSCSWNTYREDPLATNPARFSIDDDYKVTTLPGEPDLKCKPELFGYTDEKAAEVFPDLTFKHCRDKVAEESQALKIDVVENLLTMNCTGSFPGKYVLGTASTNETFILVKDFQSSVNLYKGPVRLSDQEWALGSCHPDATKFEQADYQHRHKAEARTRAQSLMKSQSRKLSSGRVNSPQAILLLTVDSASRRHMYRKLPKTVAYLQEISRTYSVTDFKIHNVIGDNSALNQIPLFTGQQTIRKVKDRQTGGYYQGDGLNGKSLLRYLKEMGYVSLMALEFCHPYFIEYLGTSPDVDHIMGNFWCGAKKHAGYYFEKMVSGQRCIGGDFSHNYLLRYLLQFTESYRDVNQFMYAHLTTGHEATGRQIQTLDDDLVDFLQSYLTLTAELGIEPVIFLQGDHGMRYGAWYNEAAAFQEHRLPALFLIMPMSLVSRLPSAAEVLAHNSERLVSKLDIHLSVKMLAYAAYTPRVGRISRYNRLHYSDNWLKTSVSLFTEKISNFRSCASIHIPAYWCSCHNMVEVATEAPYLRQVVSNLLEYTLLTLNSRTQTTELAYGYNICRKLTLREVKSVEVSSLSANDEAFQIEFSVNENAARLQVYLVVGKELVYFRVKKDNEDAYLPAPFNFNGTKLKVRLFFVKRLDSYYSVCEDHIRELNLDPSLCMCSAAGEL
jgi:hypothetical protein